MAYGPLFFFFQSYGPSQLVDTSNLCNKMFQDCYVFCTSKYLNNVHVLTHVLFKNVLEQYIHVLFLTALQNSITSFLAIKELTC